MARGPTKCGAEAFSHALCSLMARGVRGTKGVPWAAAFLAANIALMAFDYDALCLKFVESFNEEAKSFDKPTEFGHNEGLHGGYSGKNFVSPLMDKAARDGLYHAACSWGNVR
jgi:hypothetical protein